MSVSKKLHTYSSPNPTLTLTGKISLQPHTTLCIQFLNRENSDKNNTLPLGKQICFTIVWGCAEILPPNLLSVDCCWVRGGVGT